uniref:Uncharacterized protein n=1 Tax=Knipowitschia caucasica TaxID=637954 RepID=A0AAV2KG44_KNICA
MDTASTPPLRGPGGAACPRPHPRADPTSPAAAHSPWAGVASLQSARMQLPSPATVTSSCGVLSPQRPDSGAWVPIQSTVSSATQLAPRCLESVSAAKGTRSSTSSGTHLRTGLSDSYGQE